MRLRQAAGGMDVYIYNWSSPSLINSQWTVRSLEETARKPFQKDIHMYTIL